MRHVSVRHRVEYLLFRSVLAIVAVLGARWVHALADRFGWFVVTVVPHHWTRTDVARENVRRAYGDTVDKTFVTRVVRGMWSHAFLSLADLALAHRIRPRDVEVVADWRGDWQANEDLVLGSGRPVIELGGHVGNWEIGSILCGVGGCPMGVVARRLDNPLLDEWFRNLRERPGHELLSKNHDLPRVVEILEAGGRVAMLCDQDAGPKGVFVPFLGRPASTFRSIALLAIRNRAHVCIGYCCRVPTGRASEPTRFEIGTEEIIDAAAYDDVDGVERLTARYTASLERIVRRFPEQYFWVHRRWKTPPGAPARPARAA